MKTTVAFLITTSLGFPIPLPRVFPREILNAAAQFSSDFITPPAEDALGELHVLVSHYASLGKHRHHAESETAIAANLMNPVISSLHLLYEATLVDGCTEVMARLGGLLTEHWPLPPSSSPPPLRTDHQDSNVAVKQAMAHLHCTQVPAGRASAQELVAVYPSLLLGPLLLSNRSSSPVKVVAVVVNADVVLDHSLARLKTLKHGHAAVLTVNTGPRMENCCLGSRGPFHTVVREEVAAVRNLQGAKSKVASASKAAAAAAAAAANSAASTAADNHLSTGGEGGGGGSAVMLARAEAAVRLARSCGSGGSSAGGDGGGGDDDASSRRSRYQHRRHRRRLMSSGVDRDTHVIPMEKNGSFFEVNRKPSKAREAGKEKVGANTRVLRRVSAAADNDGSGGSGCGKMSNVNSFTIANTSHLSSQPSRRFLQKHRNLGGSGSGGDGFGGDTIGARYCATLPTDGAAAEAHVSALRRFYVNAYVRGRAEREQANGGEGLSGWFDADKCSNARWSSGGYQFCGRPERNPDDEGDPGKKSYEEGLVGSWDGYALVLPLPKALLEFGNPWMHGLPPPDATEGQDPVRREKHLEKVYWPAGEVKMNNLGVEMRVTCALEASGLKVHAPCRFVRAAHWHCEPKTYSGKQRFDKHPQFQQLINAFVAKGHPEFGSSGTCLSDYHRRPCTSTSFTPATSTREGREVEEGCGGIDTLPYRTLEERTKWE